MKFLLLLTLRALLKDSLISPKTLRIVSAKKRVALVVLCFVQYSETH